MATKIVYEPQYLTSGWFDDSGPSTYAWFDRDVAGTIIPLVRLLPPLLASSTTIYTPAPIAVGVLPGFFVNQSVFFMPSGLRTLVAPDQALKNEVRRVR